MSLFIFNHGSLTRHQRGIGMVEVLVAMLLLAIGVLGFSVLQVRAVEATGEALLRSQTLLILRGLTEEIRVNPSGQSSYPAQVRSYASYSSSTNPPTSCANPTYPSLCSTSDMATYDAYRSAQAAFALGVNISMTQCPGVSSTYKRQCLFAAWGNTTLSNVGATLTTASTTDCMTDAGVYQSQATCVMLEAY